jgi:cytoskeletal protein CcmA (bactofilin family)
MARYDVETNVIGPSTRVIGRIAGEGALRVEGRVKGDIDVSGEGEIAEGATVEGNFRADSLDISGALLGDAAVSGAIFVRSSAVVRGELKGAEIAIEPGSRVSVRLNTAFELHGKALRPTSTATRKV